MGSMWKCRSKRTGPSTCSDHRSAWAEYDIRGRSLPAKVVSLDENFIIMRREANLCLSRDIGGFHWYGSELCLIAAILGWNAYVIDFHLCHKSQGNPDVAFFDASRRFRDKYARLFRARWLYSPTRRTDISLCVETRKHCSAGFIPTAGEISQPKTPSKRASDRYETY